MGFIVKEIFKENFFSQPRTSIIIDSRFSVVFPKYQEKNLIEKWYIIKRILRFHNIETSFNLKKNVIEISTTNKTIDPYSIINARDFLKLLSRGVPIHQAAKIFNENIFCDVVKISGFTNNKKIFLNRRKRIIGNNGSTIKVIELLTKSYILIQGNTVSCIGNFKNIKFCRKIIEDCMKNIHPFIHIRNLVIKRKLLKSRTLRDKSWDKFVPMELLEGRENNNKKKRLKEPHKIYPSQNFQEIKNNQTEGNLNLKYIEKRNDFIFKKKNCSRIK